MNTRTCLACLILISIASPFAAADIMVDYTSSVGGNNGELLNGLAARGTFSIDGDRFTILLENTSTGVPESFDTSDSLLVSLGMNLPGDVSIQSGNYAVIGPGSVGLGSWSERIAGDSVGEQWLWTNDSGGDLMEAYTQILSTSNGQGGGTTTRFDGGSGGVSGPFGGIAADPPILDIPGSKPAVSSSIEYELTLTTALTELELAAVVNTSIVEFGSDQRYLGAPEPATAALLLAGLLLARRRR